MNDFTKEELVLLKFHVDSSLAQDGDTEGLMIKIQSMIDSHCEHKSIETLYVDGITACKDCDEVLGWN